jgi:hypothetical protein
MELLHARSHSASLLECPPLLQAQAPLPRADRFPERESQVREAAADQQRQSGLPLRVVIPRVAEQAQKDGTLVFHAIGDSGGVHGDDVQQAIADAMEAQIESAAVAAKPAFLYHLGDVIYFNGQSNLYNPQFYDPYKYYPAPIFAIPGNHDGDTKVRPNDEPDTESSLFGFMLNFCAESPSHISPYRATMTQPYVYWTLMAPFVSIIGLYSNVEGSLDARGTYEQEKWLEDQLRAVDKDSFLVVAVHHPPYSLDKAHGGTPDIASAIDQAIEVTGVVPHMVVSGHVHSYQRFTRRLKGRQIPYIVDGRGGYANAPKLMHKLQTDAQGNLPEAPVKTPSEIDPGLDLTLESFDQENPGFLRFTVTGRDTLTVESFRVPFEGTFTGEPADSVTVTHKGKIR